MTNRLIKHRHDLAIAGALMIAAAGALGLAMLVWTATLIMGVGKAEGLLREVEPETSSRIVTAKTPDSIETQHEAHIYVRYRDWRRIRTIVANDVRRHGGWTEKTNGPAGEMRYYVPSSYVKRLQPLLDSSRQKPHSTTYHQWGTQALTDAPNTDKPTETVDTAVVIRFDAPLADRTATRWTFRSTAALTATLAISALLCGLANIAGQDLNQKGYAGRS